MYGSETARALRVSGTVVVAVVALALGGCSSSPPSTTSSSPTPTPSSTSPSPTPSTTSPSPTTTSPSPTATSPSATATSPSPSASPATVTSLVITVQGCPVGCRIFAEQDGTAAKPLARPWQISGLVRDGRVTLRVPVKRTVGMHFSVNCAGDYCNANNAAPVVVLRYRGIAVGATVTDSVARNRPQASGCWVGTTSATATIALHVTTFPDTIYERKANSIRAWASPQVAVVPSTWETTYRGGLGTQDIWPC